MHAHSNELKCVCSPPNSYVEVLIPNFTIIGDRTFRR